MLIKLTLLLHRGGRHIVKQRVKQSSKTLVKILKTPWAEIKQVHLSWVIYKYIN